ncbi:MAG: hypothetical protein ACYDH6_02695 [Acidimicrobiales bacterium]
MRPHRITGAILALGIAVMAPWSAAAAHPAATVYSITVGVTSEVLVLVPADFGKSITRIDIDLASGYRLDRAGATSGRWQVTRTGSTVTFGGDTIAAADAAVFTLTGAATSSGELLFPVTTHSPDGTMKRYAGKPPATDAGVVLYAGTSPRHFPTKAIGIGALVGAGALGTIVVIWRRRGLA